MAAAPSNHAVKVIRRAFVLLDVLASSGGELSLQDLVRFSGLPVGTVHRLLQTLTQGGYVRQDDSRVYLLGPRLMWLGGRAGRILGAWARPQLSALVSQTGETASLVVLSGAQAIYVAQAPSAHSLRTLTELGLRVPLHATAAGKVLLAAATDSAVDALLGPGELSRITATTVTDRQALLRELAEAREKGYALEHGEQEVGVTALAVGVPGQPHLAVSISGPSHRMPLRQVGDLVTSMVAAADAIAAIAPQAEHVAQPAASTSHT